MSSAAYPSLRRASLVLTLLLTLSSIIPSTSADLGTIKLKSRQHRSPRHPLLRRSVVSESLTDYYNGTDLQKSEHPLNICRWCLILDRLSNVLLPSSECTSDPGCTSLKHLFDSSKSTTFYTNNLTFNAEFATGTGVQASDYENVTGIVARDTLSVAGLSASDYQFGLITDQTAGFGYDPFDGIVGMAFSGALSIGTSTFLEALNRTGEVDSALYGLSLAPETVGGAEITLGDIDECKLAGDVNYVPVNSSFGLFQISFDDVYVSGQQASIPGQATFMDSGTANLVAPDASSAEAIYSLISSDIKAFDSVGTYAIPCSKLASLDAPIVFAIGGKNYTVPGKELSVGPLASNPDMCQTLITAGGGWWILGASLLKYYYSVWDVGNERFGLAETAYSP